VYFCFWCDYLARRCQIANLSLIYKRKYHTLKTYRGQEFFYVND